jgi:filamin
VEAYGPGLQPTGVTVNAVAEFTVDASKAGLLTAGQLPVVTISDGSSTPLKVEIIDNKNSTFTCRYTPTKAVLYTITLTFAGTAVCNSPFKVKHHEVVSYCLNDVNFLCN